MTGKMVEFPANGGTGSGYLAIPDSGSGPGVIVIQEWWGLVDHIKEVVVEAYFLQHPSVNKIQVVGVADRRLSEIPVAFVVLEPGAESTADDLIAHAKGKVASFKIPQHFFFIEEYPMTSSGKVKRFELRAMAREKLGIEAPDIEQGAREEAQTAST